MLLELSMSQLLKYRVEGDGQPLVILHGLFGTMDNWRTMARKLAEEYQVILVDLRNHGRSFWSDQFNYELLAQDVIGVMDHLGLSQASIAGHSMGGKVSFQLAQNFQDRIDKLIVLDIGFRGYPGGHESIFNAVLGLDLKEIRTRSEADRRLAKAIQDPAIRQFLLKSLKRDVNEGFIWKTNFESLYSNYEQILSPVTINEIIAPTLIVRGSRSPYISDNDIIDINSILPDVQFVTTEAGHWLHVEQPGELFTEMSRFLS